MLQIYFCYEYRTIIISVNNFFFVGHGPFSHVFDEKFILKVNKKQKWKVSHLICFYVFFKLLYLNLFYYSDDDNNESIENTFTFTESMKLKIQIRIYKII